MNKWNCPTCVQIGPVIHLCRKCKEAQMRADKELIQALTGKGWSSSLDGTIITGKD